MKNKLLILSILSVIALGGLTAPLARAESDDNDDSSSTTTEDRRDNKKEDKKLKVKLGDNLEKNKEIRNIKKEKKEDLKDIKKATKETIEDLKEQRKNSTTTKEMFKGARKSLEQKMKRDIYETRKNALVRELTVSLSVLNSARTRINDFIVKRETASSTLVFTDAKAALVIADEKLAKAKVALDTFAAFQYSSTTASTTADIELAKPRKVGDDAIKALKDARDALKNVVKAINNVIRPHTDDDKNDDN